MRHILKCTNCSRYTMEETCPYCSHKAYIPRPPKFSPQDKYGKYRREQKKIILKEKDLY